MAKKQETFESRFLLSIFSTLNADANNPQVLRQLVGNIIKFMQDNARAFENVYPAMASIPFGKRYFFEEHSVTVGLVNVCNNNIFCGPQVQLHYAVCPIFRNLGLLSPTPLS